MAPPASSVRLFRAAALLLASFPATAQDYTFGWGSVVVDSRWHDRNDAVALKAQETCTMVLWADGTIKAVGSDGYHLCQVPSPAPGTQFTSFAVQSNLGLAVGSNGTLARWGTSITADPVLPAGVSYNRLFGGFGPIYAERSDLTIVSWDGGTQTIPPNLGSVPIVDITSSRYFSMALRNDGSVVGWGSVTIPALPSGTQYVGIAAGWMHGMLLRSDGVLMPLGDNQAGQGNVPALPPGLSYTKVWCGYNHSFAARSDGSFVAWGQNQFGQCDIPAPPTGITYAEFAGGFGFSSARRSDGHIVSWGWNRSGACNIPPLPNGVRYVDWSIKGDVALGLRSDGLIEHMGERSLGNLNLIPALPSGLAYTGVFAGRKRCFALRSDGSLIGWGDDQYGQLTVPTLPAGTTWASAAMAYDNPIALRSDGQIVVWGPVTSLSTPPALPPGLTYVAVAAGRYHALALRSDGDLVAWGDNYWGQSTPPSLPPDQRYERIAAGDYHSLVWRSDGFVVCFGQSSLGQTSAPSPTPATYTDIVAGGASSGALRSDGGATAWGNSQNGLRPAPTLPAGFAFKMVRVGESFFLAQVGDARSYLTTAAGCPGTMATTRLVPFTTPQLGRPLRVELFNLPANFALMITGWSNTQSTLGSLPLAMAPLGMPGCNLSTSTDVLDVVVGTANHAYWIASLPAQPSLAGARIYQQALVPDPTFGNPLRAVMSNATSAIVGS